MFLLIYIWPSSFGDDDVAKIITNAVILASAHMSVLVDWACQSSSIKIEAFTYDFSGVSRQNFKTEVNAKDFGFEPTDTPRTDRSVSSVCDYFLISSLVVLSSEIVIDGIANARRLSSSALFKTIDIFFTRGRTGWFKGFH